MNTETLKFKDLSKREKVNFPIHSDDRGSLFPVNANQIPFDVRRSFLVYNVPNGQTRGYHAHHSTYQFLVCVAGKLKIKMIDLSFQTKEVELSPGQGFLEKPYEWAEITFFDDGMLHAICSTDFDESDYIRDFNEFRNMSSKMIKGLE